jgi:hypothetical protein
MTPLADADLKTRLDGKRWKDARTFIDQYAALSSRWPASAHGKEAKAIDALPKETPSAELIALVDEYKPIVEQPTADAAVKRSFGKLQSRIAKTTDGELAALVKAYDSKNAEKLVADRGPRLGEKWVATSNAAIAKIKGMALVPGGRTRRSLTAFQRM